MTLELHKDSMDHETSEIPDGWEGGTEVSLPHVDWSAWNKLNGEILSAYYKFIAYHRYILRQLVPLSKCKKSLALSISKSKSSRLGAVILGRATSSWRTCQQFI